MEHRKLKLLVGCSGSVAATKLLQLVQLLHATRLFELKVILTKAGSNFVKDQLGSLRAECPVHFDEEEWDWAKRGDPVLHIELRKWADMLLIAPLSANSLAKIVNGICDNLLSLVVRCWDFNSLKNGGLKQPIVVCPAMNSLMYDNPITFRQLGALKEMGVLQLGPIEKKLMCGDFGVGAMEEPQKIVAYMVRLANQSFTTPQVLNI